MRRGMLRKPRSASPSSEGQDKAALYVHAIGPGTAYISAWLACNLTCDHDVKKYEHYYIS